jgi:hypothetical protein
VSEGWAKSREFLKEFTADQRQMLREATVNEIYEWVVNDAAGAADYIFEKLEGDEQRMLDWVAADHDDEGVLTVLGFWPWKDDPIPATELGMEVNDV